MRHLQTYRLFESVQSLTQNQKDFLTRHTRGTWSLNPSTGLVDVEGDFNCSGLNLENFKGIQFGAVSGSFSCHSNSLTSLDGAPETVGGGFYCHFNSLTSLEGAPETVGGDFYCDSNSLTSLDGAPETVGGSFSCDSNSLTSLDGAPETVGGSFYCDSNSLTSLDGAPETVGGGFYCGSNRLTSLDGAPETVGGEFYSDDLKIPKGEWGLETFIHILTTGKPEEQKLVSSLVDPKVLQQKIDENPEGMLVKLKGRLKHPHFRSLRWPERLKGEKELMSDLDGIGL